MEIKGDVNYRQSQDLAGEVFDEEQLVDGDQNPDYQPTCDRGFWVATGKLRWRQYVSYVRHISMQDERCVKKVLQQEWLNEGTGDVEWRDVPVE